MRRLITSLAGICAATIFMAAPLYAGPTDDPGVQNRKKNQQTRIDQGVNSGDLTRKEAARLEREQAKIKKDEERMKSDGTLTKKERKKLHREQDRASKHIYKEKHDRKKVNPHD